MMDATLLFDPADMVDMVCRGETLPDRWNHIAATVMAITGASEDAVAFDLLNMGYTQSCLELCSFEVCNAIVQGSVNRILIVSGRVASGITVH